jgi:hypothetical protein
MLYLCVIYCAVYSVFDLVFSLSINVIGYPFCIAISMIVFISLRNIKANKVRSWHDNEWWKQRKYTQNFFNFLTF